MSLATKPTAALPAAGANLFASFTLTARDAFEPYLTGSAPVEARVLRFNVSPGLAGLASSPSSGWPTVLD